MSKLSYNTYSEDDIIEEFNNRIFPIPLMILKNPKGIDSLIEFSIKQLNKYTSYTRFIQIPINGYSEIDTSSEVLNLTGINIKRVNGVYSTYQVSTFLDVWRQWRNQPAFYTNLYRNNDSFLEYTQAEVLYKQIQKKWNNKNNSWQYIPGEDKIILDSMAWKNQSEASISFLAEFSKTATEWEMWEQEFDFVVQMMKSEAFLREGLAKSNSVTMGIETNFQLLIDEGKEIRAQLLEEWEKSAIFKCGRRF
jgi:hypothetical protein